MFFFNYDPPPSPWLSGSWENCLTGHCLKLRWPPDTWPKLLLSTKEFDQGCPISWCLCGWGDHTHQGVTPPPFPNQGLSPHPKFFGPPLNWHFCPQLTKKFPRALRTISLYLFNIFVNRIKFNCIGEQLCCWLIQMFIHKPFSLHPFEWTAQLTIVWFAVSYRIRFMACRISF